MSNINDHRVDIAGQDWYAENRADGDYIAWRYVEPILEATREMLEALQAIDDMLYRNLSYADRMRMRTLARRAIAKAKGGTQ